MDFPVPVEEHEGATAENPPAPEPVVAESAPEPEPQLGQPAAPDDVAAQLAALTRRVEELAGGLDTAVRQAVAEEVQRVAGELQHTVTALGRILVRDLGKLSQILGEHRDTIVAELRNALDAAPREGGVASAMATAPATEPAVTSEELDDDGTEPSGDDPQGAAGRQWRNRRRKG